MKLTYSVFSDSCINDLDFVACATEQSDPNRKVAQAYAASKREAIRRVKGIVLKRLADDVATGLVDINRLEVSFVLTGNQFVPVAPSGDPAIINS